MINVKQNLMEVFVKANRTSRYGQQSAVFKDEREEESKNHSMWSMHFATVNHLENKRIENWHRLVIKKDFIDVLRTYGRLPIADASD